MTDTTCSSRLVCIYLLMYILQAHMCSLEEAWRTTLISALGALVQQDLSFSAVREIVHSSKNREVLTPKHYV
jgi:hypothetical protein